MGTIARDTISFKRGAIAGWVGASVLGGAIATLTYAEYDFLRGLGWHPILAPTHDWPSGLALGPFGWIMIGAFLASGAAMFLFARAIRLAFASHGRLIGALFSGSALALLLLAAPTDPTNTTITPTLFGMLHDAAFVILGLTFFPGLITTAVAAWRDPDWHWLTLLTFVVAGLSAPAFLLKGFWFYFFLIGALGWIGIVATQLWRLAHQEASNASN